MDSGPKEIELKLRVSPENMATLRTHPNFAEGLGEPVKETLVSVYFDSDEFFLRDHGLTLRVRHIGDKRIQMVGIDHDEVVLKAIKDGFVYGRGAVDMKGASVMQLIAFLLLARSKTPLKRDVIFCGVPDEEARRIDA